MQIAATDQIAWGNSIIQWGRAQYGTTFAPGQSIGLDFLWQARRPQSDDWAIQVWLERAGQTWGMRRFLLGGGYPPTAWAGTPLVRQWVDYPLPANLPDGSYRLYLSLLRAGVAQRRAPMALPWLPGPARYEMGAVTIKGRERAFDVPAVAQRLDVSFGSAVALLGWEMKPAEIDPGDTLDVRLIWKALGPMDRSYSVFVHLLDGAGGKIAAQHDSPPGLGTLPTSGWVAGEVVDDRHPLSLPASLPAGRYLLLAGLYDPLTGERLPAQGASPAVRPDHVVLGEISIR